MVRLNQNRSKLLLGCGSAALAMGLAAAPDSASAQAIQASESEVSGSISRIFTGTGSETIVVNTPTAVVNWTPDEDGQGNALDYLPNGNIVTFENSVNITDFAILNRILPSANGDVVVFDGTLISQLVDVMGEPLGPGGTVAFYSPTGIFIGGNAVFDVGNLILTTLDPDLSSFDDFALNGGQLQMFGQSGTTAQIIFAPGSQITATAENSFFAVTAAEIQFFGNSSVNGSTAFIGGEQVNITVSNGLFDIQIPVGSSSPVPIAIDGDVGGPSSTGITDDNHLIYAVAAAQSDPISLLFSGNLGFDTAASAGIVNGEIILSANYAVSGRSVDGGSVDGPIDQLFDANSEVTDVAGSIFMEDFVSTSTILAIANEEVQVTAFNGPSSIDGNLLMVGRNFAELTASNNQSFNITGDALVSSRQYGLFGTLDVDADANATGGDAFIDAFGGGVMVINGNALVTAEALGGFNVNTGFAGSATGGIATVASNGGSLTINGDTTILAGADGAITSGVLTAGDATGGVAQLFAALGGAVTVNGNVLMGTSAFGSGGTAGPGSIGGNAFGGSTVIQALSGGSLFVDGALTAEANAFGGGSDSVETGTLGDGGQANLFIENNETITVTGDLVLGADGRGGGNLGGRGGDGLGGAARAFLPNDGTLSIGGLFVGSANGRGGDGIGGGDAFGGISGAQVLVGSLDVGSDVFVDAVGIGGNSLDGFGGDGGNGTGGNAFFQADGTLIATASINVGGGASLDATGRGGRGGDGDGDTFDPGNGGIGSGGGSDGSPNQADPNFTSGAFLLAGGDNGNLTIAGASSIFNFGIGGDGGDGVFGQDGGDGGAGIGGFVQAGSALLGNDGSVGAGTIDLGDLALFANGEGGAGGNGSGTGSIRGDGGDGEGFGAVFSSRAGTTTTGNININADGSGGEGHVGGAGTGGAAEVQAQFGTDVTTGSISAFAIGRGGIGDNQGGDAFGGTALFQFGPFDMQVNGDLLFDAGAIGGGVSAGPGGNATGGLAQIALATAGSDLAVSGDLNLRATATAANGNTASQGALATGGTAAISITSVSSVDVGGNVDLESSAVGGSNFGSGQGGDAIGGRAAATVSNGGNLSVANDVFANTEADGGVGADGGDAFGGFSQLFVSVGTMNIVGSADIDADGRGGAASSPAAFGGQGGEGTGGRAEINAFGSLSEVATISIGATASATAGGFGGIGGNGDGSATPAGRGGDGTGGNGDSILPFDGTTTGGAFIVAGADNGNLSVGGAAFANAIATGGTGGNGGGTGQAGGDGGDAFGGTSAVGLLILGVNDGSVGLGTADFGSITARADTFGGSGGAGGSTGNPAGDGGNATGRIASVFARAGTLTSGAVSIFADGSGGSGSNGGIGTGGQSGFFMSLDGTAVFDSYFARSGGFGGVGSNGVGGVGQGGTAFLGFQDGTATINGNVTVEASGFGGSSANGDGADGFGGSANISIFNANTGNGTVSGHSQVSASGVGGNASSGFTGGTGTGGEAFVQAQAGGTITLDSLQVVASGQGGSGSGANGGAGLGGLADLISTDTGSQLTILNGHTISGGVLAQGFSLVSATGIGGESQGGTGVGGTGTGGEAIVSAQDGGVITLPANPGSLGLNRIIARGVGGNSAVDGGTGGLGIGGLGEFEVSGGTINTGPVQLSTFGQGGTGSNGSINVDGGDGVGGDRQINVEADGTINGTFSAGTAGGLGGNGTGTGNGGNASGGFASIFMDSGELNLTGQSIVVTQNFGGAGVIGGSAEESTVDVAIVGGALNILPDANGAARLVISGASFGGQGTSQGGDARGGDVSVLFSEATVTGGALIALADGTGGSSDDLGGLGQAGEVFVVGTNADISLSGQIQIAAEGFGGAGVTGGDALGGVASLDIFQTAFSVGTDATGISEILIESSGNAGDGSSQVGNATAGLSQLLMLDASIVAGSLLLASEAAAESVATGTLGGVAAGGEIEAIIEGTSELQVNQFSLVAPAFSGPGGSSSGGVVGLTIGGPSGDPDLNAGQVNIDANALAGDGNTAGQFLVELRSGQLAVGSLFAEALGDLGTPAFDVSSINANGGDLLVSNAMGVNVTDDFDIEFAQGSIIGGPTIADPTASINITSQGTISIIGDNDNFIGFGGLNMDLASRDIDIEDGARFGAVNLTLRSLNIDNPAIIGGNSGSDSPGPGEGYVLSQQEAGRIEVGNFLFIQPLVEEAAPNAPDIIIRDITVFGSLDDSASSITVTTDSDQPGGIIRVDGVVVYSDAASSDQFGLFAPGGRIEIVTPGGIGVVDSVGNPSGNLFLGANAIWIADSDLIALLQDSSTFAGRNDQLAVAASGSNDPLGYLRGAAVSIEVGSQLLVRNTGTTSAQGGILVGDGGLSIFAGQNSESSLDVFAYGARLESNGNLVTGLDFYQEVNFNNDGSSTGSTVYTNEAEFNDCLINTGECDIAVGPEPEGPTNEESADPVIVSINNPTVFEAPISTVQPIPTSERESDSEFGIDFPGFVESEDLEESGDVEDPVASGGDSSLYIFGGIVRVDGDDDDNDEDED